MEIIAVLDNIRSMHNVGSILRTADAAGIKTAYLCGITPSIHDRFGVVRSEISKTALGSEKTVATHHRVSCARTVTLLKKKGYFIIALEQVTGSVPYTNIASLCKKHNIARVALIVGNEINGVSSAILSRADYTVEIPMHGKKESLNVAVAFGIAVYAFAYKTSTL